MFDFGLVLTVRITLLFHRRRLKMQHVLGSDDFKIPQYLYFLKYLGILRQSRNQPYFSKRLPQNIVEVILLAKNGMSFMEGSGLVENLSGNLKINYVV